MRLKRGLLRKSCGRATALHNGLGGDFVLGRFAIRLDAGGARFALGGAREVAAKGGLGGRPRGLGGEVRLTPHPLLGDAKSAAPGTAKSKAPTFRRREVWATLKGNSKATAAREGSGTMRRQ